MPTTFLSVTNNAESTLSSGISDTDLSLTVAAGEGTRFPAIPSSAPFHITIDNEIIEVGARSGDVLSSLVRARQGTAAVLHSTSATVELRVTAKSVSDLNTAVRATENRETEIDFGAIAAYDGSFSITDADVTTASLITAVQSSKAATGKEADENQMDGLILSADPAAGSFTLNAHAIPGPVAGAFKVNYKIG